MRSKSIVHSKGKELRVPGADFWIEDDGPGIVVEDRLWYSSDVMKKCHMGVKDIQQGSTRDEEGKSVQRMVECE